MGTKSSANNLLASIRSIYFFAELVSNIDADEHHNLTVNQCCCHICNVIIIIDVAATVLVVIGFVQLAGQVKASFVLQRVASSLLRLHHKIHLIDHHRQTSASCPLVYQSVSVLVRQRVVCGSN